MKLFHTSPDKIAKVSPFGLFGDGLCFSSSPYFMTASAKPVVYSVEIDESEIIEARSFFYREDCTKLDGALSKIMGMVGCDEDAAQDLLSGKTALIDIAEEFDADQDFEIQKLALDAAKTLGFRAVKLCDEQGAMWLVSMLGREDELILEQQ